MILAAVGFVLGCLFGLFKARRAKGNTLDQLQYAAVYGIIFAVAGMILAIVLVRIG